MSRLKKAANRFETRQQLCGALYTAIEGLDHETGLYFFIAVNKETGQIDINKNIPLEEAKKMVFQNYKGEAI